jgi:hypothetical protein
MEKAPCSSRYSLPPACGWPEGHFSHTLHLPPSMAWAMAKACLGANTAQPFKNGGTTHEYRHRHHNRSHRQPLYPEPSTAAATEAANLERGHRSQCQSPYRAVGRGTQRRSNRLPHGYGQVPQLQLREHLGDRTAEAERNPRCRNVCVEPARPQGQQGREGHPHLGSHDRRSSQEGRRSREGCHGHRISPS